MGIFPFGRSPSWPVILQTDAICRNCSSRLPTMTRNTGRVSVCRFQNASFRHLERTAPCISHSSLPYVLQRGDDDTVCITGIVKQGAASLSLFHNTLCLSKGLFLQAQSNWLSQQTAEAQHGCVMILEMGGDSGYTRRPGQSDRDVCLFTDLKGRKMIDGQ